MQVLIGTALHADVCSYCAADCGIAITRRPDPKPFLVGCRNKCSNLFPVELESNKVTSVSVVLSPSVSVLLDPLYRGIAWAERTHCATLIAIIYIFFLPLTFPPNFACCSSHISLLSGSSLYSHTKCTVLKFILCSQSP